MSLSKQFLSDNAASVHPAVWDAMRAADEADAPYDGDVLSQRMDAAFTQLFAREWSALWAATGTAANCLALGTMVQPHGGVICHREAHIEMDEGGAPGFYLHGAKLMLADGEGAKLTPESIRAVMDSVREGVHQVHPHAISITQASEWPKIADCRCTWTVRGLPMLRRFSAVQPRRLRGRSTRSASAV